MHFTKKIISFFSLLLTICIMFSSCSYKSEKFQTGNIIEAKNAGEKYHTFSKETETIAKNDFIELCIDKNNHSVIVKDIQENYTWSALPEEKNGSSYSFGLTLYTNNGIYKLNTQDNSVAFSASSYKIENEVLTVNYILSDNAETAKKSIEEMTEDDIFVSFSAVFTMKEQSVTLNVDFSQIKCTKGAFIAEFYAMPSFGSSYADTDEDYFLVPDGSGAIMHLGKEDAVTDNVTVNVYGENPYNPDESAYATSVIPVFGVKRSNSAFSAIITDGDALTKIIAKRATDDNPSEIFAKFIITEVRNIQAEDGSLSVYKGVSYNKNISIVYKFLSGRNAVYSGMASAAREEFINRSVLSSSKTDLDGSIPFCLTIVGQQDKTNLTTIQQTNDILGMLKGKGIGNIHLNYKGLLSGGFAQNNLYNARINNQLGGKNGLSDLYEYAQTQNCTLTSGINIFSSAKKYSSANKSFSIDGSNSVFSLKNDLSFDEKAGSALSTRIGKEAFNLGTEKKNPELYSQTASYSMNLLNIEKLTDKFQKFLDNDIFDSINGISITDAGSILYSDRKTDRQTAMNTVSSLLRAVSNHGSLSIEGGNIYTLYNADIITRMDFDTFYIESENYEAVPFVQSILHGTVLYSGKPIDAGNPLYRYEMLRYIEYGAVPSYEWIYSDENVYCYSGYLLSERITEVVDFYNDVSSMFTDLADDTIVNHRKIEKDSDGNTISGVYCTTYSDGTEIYVNYSGNIVYTQENIAVGPYDYVKVKR